MTPAIFHLDRTKELVRMNRANYLSEQQLQDLIALHPELLGRCTAASDGVERELLLIKQEMPIAKPGEAPGTWSIDHFYIDQQGVPTLVEVKRSTDSRIRREVVGQILDYAANAVVYWPVEVMQQRLVAQWGDRAEEKLATFLQPTEMTPDAFWHKVDANLRAKRVRLVFVADELPVELKRIIEFLNDQLRETEVLGLELPQFIGGDHQTIAPSLIGDTVQAAAVKRAPAVYPELDEVVAAFRRLTNDAVRVSGSGHYRQIPLGPKIPLGKIHYEFQSWADGPRVTAEFHVEAGYSSRWELAMRQLGSSVPGASFDVRRGKPVLAMKPPSNEPAAVAQAMVDLMQETQTILQGVAAEQ